MPPGDASNAEADATLLLERAGAGDAAAAGALLPLVYAELRRVAQAQMNGERADHTLQATALVHEAFARLIGPAAAGPDGSMRWQSKSHFFFAAANAMRLILIDHARARKAEKRGGPAARRVPLTVADLAADVDPDEILALDEALLRLEDQEPEVAQVVRLRFYAGLSGDQAAQALGMSPRQIDRLWAYARAWLFRSVQEQRAG